MKYRLSFDDKIFADFIAFIREKSNGGSESASLKKWIVSGGRIKVESKDKAKKRIGRSPDCGDAVVEILNVDLVPKKTQKVYHGIA